MAKINILKSKLNGKRSGDFSLTDSRIIIFKINFQTKPEFKKELLELLSKYFNILTLNQNSKSSKRGSVGKIRRYEERKDAHK